MLKEQPCIQKCEGNIKMHITETGCDDVNKIGMKRIKAVFATKGSASSMKLGPMYCLTALHSVNNSG